MKTAESVKEIDERLEDLLSATIDEIVAEDQQEAAHGKKVFLMNSMPLKEWVRVKWLLFPMND